MQLAKDPISRPVPAIYLSTPEDTAKLVGSIFRSVLTLQQFATDQRDVVLEDVLLLKYAIALGLDSLVLTALSLFAPAHAKTEESV